MIRIHPVRDVEIVEIGYEKLSPVAFLMSIKKTYDMV